MKLDVPRAAGLRWWPALWIALAAVGAWAAIEDTRSITWHLITQLALGITATAAIIHPTRHLYAALPALVAAGATSRAIFIIAGNRTAASTAYAIIAVVALTAFTTILAATSIATSAQRWENPPQ